MRPVIGITSGRIYNKDRPYSPYVYGEMHTYVEAIEKAGGVPLILPMTTDSSVIDGMVNVLDGMLFSGGNDISSDRYGEAPRDIRNNDPERDTFEIALLQRASDKQTPILGLCRGMQLMNIMRGGTLYQNVIDERPNTQNHDGYLEVKSTEHLAHTLRLVPNSQLAQILDASTIKSNTHHHQAINRLGEGLTVNATAEDGVIEGIEDTSGPYFLGVQPHPESIFQRAEPEWLKLFESFISAAQSYHNSASTLDI